MQSGSGVDDPSIQPPPRVAITDLSAPPAQRPPPVSPRLEIINRDLAQRYDSAIPDSQATTIPPASYDAVHTWQNHVYNANSGHPIDALVVLGPTAEDIAGALLRLLKFHFRSRDTPQAAFEPPPGVVCELQPLNSFVQRFPTIEMCVS